MTPSKIYCNVIHENTTSTNQNNQIYHDKIGERKTIQVEQKDFTFEHTKWFNISNELFEHINVQSIHR